MERPQLDADLTVAEVVTQWPETILVFMRHRMACVGCAIAPFETLGEVAEIYRLELSCFLGELEQMIDQTEGRS